MASCKTGFAHHFGIENIPFGVATSKADNTTQCVSRIGDEVILLGDLQDLLQIKDLPEGILKSSTLNHFAALGDDIHRRVRKVVQTLARNDRIPGDYKKHLDEVQMKLPVAVGDFTDFSCSSHHNRNAGQALMGASRDLPPGYLHMPLGYAGRSGSIQVSGTPVTRPRGQYLKHGIEGMQGNKTEVVYGPTQAMDFEIEIGAIVGKPVPYSEYVLATEAKNHIFGYVLLNDWSARDIQQLEMRPVGPLNSKHAATTISPWVITPSALEGFQAPARPREKKLAPHLHEDDGKLLAASVQASIRGPNGEKSQVVCETTSTTMDWTFEALLAHQSSSGCGLRSGDILGIGTISGPGPQERGCLLEQFAGDNQRYRGYLEDDEEVQLSAYCGVGVGFGECKARILPAKDNSTWRTV